MRKVVLILAAAFALLAPRAALAVKVADITRLGGQRPNVLTGLGLVVGLKGTGDGGDYLPAIKPLAGMLSKFANPTTVKELGNVDNVALVLLSAKVPPNGVRDGDQIDVYVMSQGAAKSLKGGRLFITPMTGPIPDSGIFAMAEGAVQIEDPSTPTVGVVKGGAVMEADMPAQVIDPNGRFSLILHDPAADWTTASTIAKTINDAEGSDGEILAVAIDPKNVIVQIPQGERARPDSFISRVRQLPVPLLPTEARVQVNERTGTLIVTGDVEISPVVISHKGLTITTVDPEPRPSPRNPVLRTQTIVPLDTTRRGGAKLQDLVNALEQLKVPAEDRITIVKELYKTGMLHAKLIIE
jgi:flagellar P-ring protein precursor FlgI